MINFISLVAESTNIASHKELVERLGRVQKARADEHVGNFVRVAI